MIKPILWLLTISAALVATGCNRADNIDSGTAESAQVDATPFVLSNALARAQQEKKPVLLEFTGSDWCPPCKMLEKEVLSTDEFKKFKETNIIFGKLDYPRRLQQSDEVKKNNAELAEKFGIEAFPTLVLLDGEGKELWRAVGLDDNVSTPKALIGQIEKHTAK